LAQAHFGQAEVPSDRPRQSIASRVRYFALAMPLFKCLVALAAAGHLAQADIMGLLGQITEDGRKDGLKGTWAPWKKMPIYISLPGRQEGVENPFVIVAHHAVGLYNDPFLRTYCDDLAAEGYVCMLPDFFWRVWSDKVPNGHGMDAAGMNIQAQLKSQNDVDLLADVKGAIDFAKDVGSDANIKVGIVGFSLGGRIAWLAGTSNALAGSVSGIVSYDGGNLFKAFPEDAGTSAPGERLKDLHCPVLGHFAGKDENPSSADQARLQQEGDDLAKDLEFYTYNGVRHGFACKDSQFYEKFSAKDAWPRTLDFLKRIFGTSVTVEAKQEKDPHGLNEL